jgi:ElaB/YqjD/DUF883 family membrane-anchored ribosome-binding protein
MVTSPTRDSRPVPGAKERKPAECPPDNKLPENTQEHLDAKLDHAIEETFPTSDPVSVSITKGGAIDYDRQDAAAAPTSQRQEGQGTAESLRDRAQETLHDVTGNASRAAREAYNRAKRHVRETGERYPEAERYFREGSRAVSQRMSENPWLSLAVAGAVGYGLAWMVHGRSGSQDERVPDYARTTRGYAPHRDERHGR